MVYKIYYTWYDLLEARADGEFESNASIKEGLMRFLEDLNLSNDRLEYYDTESLEEAYLENPTYDKGYKERIKELQTDPRKANIPITIFEEHTKDGKEHSLNAYLEDQDRYKLGFFDGVITKFQDIDFKIRCETHLYPNLLSLAKESGLGYVRNIGVFFPDIHDIDEDSLSEEEWHEKIRPEVLLDEKKHYLDLEKCLKPSWDLSAEELISPHKSGYVSLGLIPGRAKDLHLAFDFPDYEEGTVTSYLKKINSKAADKFFEKNIYYDDLATNH